MDRSTPIRQQVHGTVMALLENGCVPWRLPLPHRGEGHLNFLSGRPYGGVDPILLGLALAERGGTLPWWCTFAEARQAGLSPRRGAKGVHLGLARPRQGPGHRLEVVFNASDLVGATFQARLAHRGRLVQCRHRFRGEHRWREARQAPPPGLASGRDEAGDRQAFIHELAWTLMADRMGLSKSNGVYGLVASDWIQRLRDAPQTFFELLADAGTIVDRLAAGEWDERMC